MLACVQATDVKAQASSSAELARELYTLFAYLLTTSTPDFFRALSDLDVSLTQAKLLHTLEAAEDELSLKDLAERLSFSLAAASRAIDALRQRGLVERREDERDRRMKRVTITAEGREVLRRLNEMRIAQLEGFADTMTGEERAALHAALTPIVAREEIGAFRR
jgi:DNA-binding MarR family transcriptional regulator